MFPGGSRLLVEAQIPYDALALATFLGFAPAQACSVDTAVAMARAYGHARPGWCRPVPIWLASARRRHWLVIARAKASTVSYRIRQLLAGIAHCTGVMAKGRRGRAAEEDLVSSAIVLWLAHACGIAAPSPRTLLEADEYFADTASAAVDTIDQLLAGELKVASPPSPMAK